MYCTVIVFCFYPNPASLSCEVKAGRDSTKLMIHRSSLISTQGDVFISCFVWPTDRCETETRPRLAFGLRNSLNNFSSCNSIFRWSINWEVNQVLVRFLIDACTPEYVLILITCFGSPVLRNCTLYERDTMLLVSTFSSREKNHDPPVDELPESDMITGLDVKHWKCKKLNINGQQMSNDLLYLIQHVLCHIWTLG